MHFPGGLVLPLSAIEWTQVILAAITAFTTIITTCISAWLYIQLRTPSGKSVGEMVERTEHLASVNTMHLMKLQDGIGAPPSTPPPDDVN